VGSDLTLLLSEKDVALAVKLVDVIDGVEDGFRQYGLGLAQTLPRREVRILRKELPHADVRMTFVSQGLAFLEQSQVVAVQHVLNFPEKRTPGMRCVNLLISSQDGSVMAVVDSVPLLRMRTGAAGAVGARYLSRKNSKIASIVGSGRQGRIALRFLHQVRKIETAYAYSLVPKEADDFSKEMGAELGIEVLPSNSIEKMVRDADIVITTTQSTSPIVKAEWLSPGVHINIVGADDPPKIELEGVALKRANKLVIAGDDCHLAGQLRIPEAQGIISKNDVYGTIGEIVAGLKPGRESEDEITIFHSPGLTLQDGAAVYKVYQKAKELGLGVKIPDPLNYF
jgi:alanine dehydrogenase